jgi:RHS repeat-associated protein
VAQNQNTYNYGFNFDPIGNRLTSSSTETGSTVSTSYTANNLNQYSLINDGAPKTPSYDFDGNMTNAPLSSGTWTNTWSGDNALASMEKAGQRLEFKYDYTGRRSEKKVIEGGTTTKNLRFAYDGFKLAEELDGLNSNAILKKIVWNGEEPYSITDTALNATYYYVLDANKNVSELIDAAGNRKAHYEYSPFGKIITQSGDYADENPIRFSSEYFDVETGLVYYNFRYYYSEGGRWFGRDLIDEEGGENLYAMCLNDSVNLWDYLGLQGWTLLITPKPIVPKPAIDTIVKPATELTKPITEATKPATETTKPKCDCPGKSDGNLPQLPKNPDDLLKAGYKETTDPRAAAKGHRDFINEETGDKVSFDKGVPGKDGFKWEDHYHRFNPDKTGKGDQYLDKNGKPVPKGSVPSHLVLG